MSAWPGSSPVARRRRSDSGWTSRWRGAQGFRGPDDIREAGREREVRAAVGQWRQGPLVLWLYTPAALPFPDLLAPDLVVYDVMDELGAFEFPSGVDRAHFARALDDDLPPRPNSATSRARSSASST